MEESCPITSIIMRHPFLPDLSDKSMEDISKTLTDLTGKLNFAYRSQNGAMIHQLNMVIEGYREEYNKRMNALYKKHNLDEQINITTDKK